MRTLPALALALLIPAAAHAQGLRDVEIKPTKITDSIYMLEGQGGNMGLSIGEDGAFLIDDQFAPLTGKILEAIGSLTDKPVKFLVNTHWHGDHTGGNENFGGTGAIIVAHHNVRKRMSTEQEMKAFNRTVPPSPDGALPVITFTDSMTFHWNGDALDIRHVQPAHTDGDAIIHFRRANVIHMGDTYFNGMYPFIDVGSGGNIAGMIKAAERALELCNAETKIIPGHGGLSNPQELRAYRDMLQTAHRAIRRLKADDMSRDEAIAAKPTKDLDGTWGGGFMQPDVWVGIVYDGLRD